VNAGVDVLLGCPEPEQVRTCLRDAVVSEKIPLRRVDRAAGRVLALKAKLKNLGPGDIRPGQIDSSVASPSKLEVADRVAEDSITLLRDRRKVLPVNPDLPLSLLNISFTAGYEPDLDKPLEKALRKSFSRVVMHRLDSQAPPARLEETWREAEAADIVLCSMFTNQPPEYSAQGFTPTQVELAGRIAACHERVIMACFGDPRTLALFPDVDCFLCMYSDCAASQAALVRDISGKLVMPVKGKLPVTLDASFPYGFGLDMAR
ncbi:MAG: hypothetical protein U9P14_11875, partial [Gemmatimonadota bacterium]|nr:hypothetical protein [Gemmatimonadota bacterium]